jgi:hypothetical protein
MGSGGLGGLRWDEPGCIGLTGFWALRHGGAFLWVDQVVGV